MKPPVFLMIRDKTFCFVSGLLRFFDNSSVFSVIRFWIINVFKASEYDEILLFPFVIIFLFFVPDEDEGRYMT